jgi:hypothetical protein
MTKDESVQLVRLGDRIDRIAGKIAMARLAVNGLEGDTTTPIFAHLVDLEEEVEGIATELRDALRARREAARVGADH